MGTPTQAKIQGIVKTLLDPTVPAAHREELLKELALLDSAEARLALRAFLKLAASGNSKLVYEEKLKELQAKLRELEEGGLQCGTFIRMHKSKSGNRRCKVKLEDGRSQFPMVLDDELAARLRRGDSVMLDAQAKVVLDYEPMNAETGDEAVLERGIGDGQVEVTVRGDDRGVFDASQDLIDALGKEEVAPGRRLLVSCRQQFAFAALPQEDGLAHYQYLDRSPVPNVIIERDIGAPPQYIDEVLDMIRMEMTDPSLRRTYRLPRFMMRLLIGPTGTGKTLSFDGLRHAVCDLMSEIAGVSVEDLPPRVMRLRNAQVLSMWFGQSEKNLDRFFSEVEQLACEPFVGADGKEHTLPVLVILEELDGLARSRGHDAIYDRVLTTVLERMDPGRQSLQGKLIVFLATTNVPEQVDTAILRRIGGTVERFGRLTRRSFQLVLSKCLNGLPLGSDNGCSRATLQRSMILSLSAWLYGPNSGDKGQVEIAVAGSTIPEVRYRRDFLTGALVNQAVRQAAEEACREHELGCEAPGVTVEMLKRSFHDQIEGITARLNLHNVHEYVTLPEGARATQVRRIEQPSIFPFELARAS